MIKNLFPIIYVKDIEFGKTNKAVLCLENYYFNIFKLNLENVLNKEDRIVKIEDQIEIHFPRYNSANFILKYEFLEKNKDFEKVMVYLFEIEKLKTICDFEEEKNLKILSIMPSFMLCRGLKIKNFINFDISPQNLVISKYEDGKLQDIIFYQNEASFIIDDNHEFDIANFTHTINSHLENIDSDFDLIFSGSKIELENLDLINRKFSFVDIEEIDFRKHLNFLPNNLQRKYILYYMNLKYLFFIFVSTIICIVLSIFLYYRISVLENELNVLETEINSLLESNENIRSELAEIEENLTNLDSDIKQKNMVDFKISDLFTELQHITPQNIKILSIEYDGVRIINILATSISLTDINIFLENIQNSKKLALENYDYILKSQNKIDFKLELSFINSQE